MAMSPRWKIYRGEEYVASVRYASDVVAIIASAGVGNIVKYAHSKVVWREGYEEVRARDDRMRMCTIILTRAGLLGGEEEAA